MTKPKSAKKNASSPAAEWIEVGTLIPWERNYRHKHKVPELARTFFRDGYGAPIVAQAKTGRIIGGHGRKLAVEALLRGEVTDRDGNVLGGPAWTIPGAPGPGFVPVRFVACDDETATRLALADNAEGLHGEDDPAALLALLGEQRQHDDDRLADMGWSDESIDAMLRASEPDGVPPIDVGKGDEATDAKDVLIFRKVRLLLTPEDAAALEKRIEAWIAEHGTTQGLASAMVAGVLL